MVKKLKKRIFFYGVCLACLFLTTCGIEEYYYLPQVPESLISTKVIDWAEIDLPSLTGYYYAQGYKIYYRIYISDYLAPSNELSQYNTISSTLFSDYNAIYPNTDPTNNTMGTPANTLFKNRSYFELALEGVGIVGIDSLLSTSGGKISILFPTGSGPDDIPYLTFNSADYRLFRSKELINPVPDKYFRNTSDLNDPDKASNANDNADVAKHTLSGLRYAYVSMYVVAYGVNPTAFTPIYSKPTHICIFKLPEF